MLVKRVAEVRTFAHSLSHKLATDELLSGTPTVELISGSGLTISGVAITEDEWIIEGTPVVKERAVQFTVAGGTSGTTYTLRITAVTDATTAQTLIEEVQLRVN